MEICSRFTGMERKDGAFLLHTDNADIKVCFVTDEIVRVRASFVSGLYRRHGKGLDADVTYY